MKYVKQLDGLRFVAVFFVLIEHFAIVVGRKISAGYYGVDLFFVISGFLITLILLNSKETFWPAYKKFLGRRTLRIFPLYYATILILFIAGNNDVRNNLFYVLTYTYNYAAVFFQLPFNSISHFWSLCVEEQFYLFWPFLVLSLRWKLKTLALLISLIVVICSLQLCFQIFSGLTPYNNTGLFPQANSLGIGALGAILHLQRKIPSWLMSGKWLESGALILLAILLCTEYNVKYVLCPILSLFFVMKTMHNGFAIGALNRFLANERIVYLGSIAYGIYIFHLPLGHYITEYLFDPYVWGQIDFTSNKLFEKLQWNSWLIKFPLYTLLTMTLAHFSYRFFERPILGLKDRWFKYDAIVHKAP